MFDHIEYSVSDITEARAFYVPICKAIGAEEIFFDSKGRELGIGAHGIVHFLIMEGDPVTPKFHICFKAFSKDSVDAAYAGAIAAGGQCNGKPGYRDHYAPGYYAAFIYDPDGHNVEILFRDPSKA